MPDHRRNRVPGGTFFFTVNLLDRRSDLLVRHIDALRDAVRRVRTRAPFRVDAWIVLPDHMHCLWSLPEGDADFPDRWRAIKNAFSKSLPVVEPRSALMTGRGERGIWQRRYWEHTIRDQRDFARHFDSIHFNPVKHGLVSIRLIGPTRRIAAALPAECIQATGRALLTNRLTPASDRDCRRPHQSKAECAALFRPAQAHNKGVEIRTLGPAANGYSSLSN